MSAAELMPTAAIAVVAILMLTAIFTGVGVVWLLAKVSRLFDQLDEVTENKIDN
jgi:hypothetical protein